MSGERGQLPTVADRAAPVTTPTLRSSLAVPAIIAGAGDRAARHFLEFFAASIENDNTRMAYYRAVGLFFAWLEEHSTAGRGNRSRGAGVSKACPGGSTGTSHRAPLRRSRGHYAT